MHNYHNFIHKLIVDCKHRKQETNMHNYHNFIHKLIVDLKKSSYLCHRKGTEIRN